MGGLWQHSVVEPVCFSVNGRKNGLKLGGVR
jgi:hypothetical protein